MRIDLHVHASERSGCARSPEDEVLAAAVDAGLAGIAFTDHHAPVLPDHLAELRERHPEIAIYAGCEVTAEENDFLVLGVAHRDLGPRGWTYRQIRHWARTHGAALVLAHPYRFHMNLPEGLMDNPPDAVEIRSCSMSHIDPYVPMGLTQTLGVPCMTNSDAHDAAHVGMFANTFPRLPADDAELVAMILAAEFEHEPIEE